MSKFEKYATIFIVVCLTIVAAGFACKFSRSRGYKAGYADAYASFKPDTEYVEKKIYIDNPVPVEVTPAGKEMYPVGTVAQLKRVIDSLAAIKPDTTLIEIPVPMETKLYRDERDSTYEAQITGYHATLDWVKVFQKTAYINVPIPTPVWPTLAISPVLNVEILPRSLFAGAGIVADYWKDRFQFSVEAGYGVNTFLYPVPATDATQATADPSEVVLQKGEVFRGVYGKFTARYNLIRK